MLYEFHLHGFLKRGRLRPLLLPVSRSPTQVLLQVTYLLQHLHALPHQARSHPPGSGTGCWTFLLLLILLFGVTMEPGLEFPSAGYGSVCVNLALGHWDSWLGSTECCWQAWDVCLQATVRAASYGDGWALWKNKATQPGAFQM